MRTHERIHVKIYPSIEINPGTTCKESQIRQKKRTRRTLSQF